METDATGRIDSRGASSAVVILHPNQVLFLMRQRTRTAGIVCSVLALVVAIGLVLLGYGPMSVLFFLAAGIGLGIFGPAVESSGTHGASDST